MSAAVITYHRGMGRWEPNARGRLEQAAMELFIERGFEQTTVTEIATRAGLTQRTFFQPGQFYRLQNYETLAPRVDGTTLAMEGLALTGEAVDKEAGLLSTIVL